MDALQLLNDGLAGNYHIHNRGVSSRLSRRAPMSGKPFHQSNSKMPSFSHRRHRMRRNHSNTPSPLLRIVPCACVAPATTTPISSSNTCAQPISTPLHRCANLGAGAVSFAQDDFIAFTSSAPHHADAFEFKSAPLRNFVACLAK